MWGQRQWWIAHEFGGHSMFMGDFNDCIYCSHIFRPLSCDTFCECSCGDVCLIVELSCDYLWMLWFPATFIWLPATAVSYTAFPYFFWLLLGIWQGETVAYPCKIAKFLEVMVYDPAVTFYKGLFFMRPVEIMWDWSQYDLGNLLQPSASTPKYLSQNFEKWS